MTEYEGIAENIRTARANVAEVIQLLKTATTENAERCGIILQNASVQLQTAANALRMMNGSGNADLRFSLEQLRREVKTLALALGESDRVVSGWIRRLGVRCGGYTERGASAPLVLVKKVNVTG